MQNEDIKNTETATPATEAPAPDNAPETNQEPPTERNTHERNHQSQTNRRGAGASPNSENHRDE